MPKADEQSAEAPNEQASQISSDSSTSYDPAEFPAYVLCGGKSVRFGTDKARVRIDGQPHLLRLANSLRSQGHETHFVSDCDDRYKDLGIVTIVDVQQKSGPMAALISAARHRAQHSGSGWFLLIGCDQLRWEPKHFQWLAAQVKTDRLAITYSAPFIQPIPGLYHTGIEAAAVAALACGQLSLKRMLESLSEVVSIDQNENPRDWCFNDKTELNNLLDKIQQEFEV